MVLLLRVMYGPPFFVKLRSSVLVADILREKKRFNPLHSRDIDPSALDWDDTTKIVDGNIYIDEVLSKEVFKSFIN